MSAESYLCMCGTETQLKKDGTPWKHNTPFDAPCFGSSDPEDDLADVKASKFVFEMSVYPNPELQNDPEWHYSNLELAEVRASKAGKTPVGEGKLKKSSKLDNGKLLLVYEVPVKER